MKYIYTERNFSLLVNFNDCEICGSNLYREKFFAVDKISMAVKFVVLIFFRRW